MSLNMGYVWNEIGLRPLPTSTIPQFHNLLDSFQAPSQDKWVLLNQLPACPTLHFMGQHPSQSSCGIPGQRHFQDSPLVPGLKCHTECLHFSLCTRHHPGRLGMGSSITDNLQGHHSSCQSKDRGFLLPPTLVTRRCLLSRVTSLQPFSLASVSHSTPLPLTAGSSFLLPSSNRKLPLRSQGCKCLTLRATSTPHRLSQAAQPGHT